MRRSSLVPIVLHIVPPFRILGVLAALLFSVVARAADDSPRAVPAPEDVQPQPDAAEVTRMATVLNLQLGTARLWYWGWAGFYGAVIIGETVVNATTSGPSRTSAEVNIATSVFGLFSTLLVPPPVVFDWEPVAKMPERTPEERLTKSAAIRALFDREVSKERFYHSALNHILGLTVNAAVTAFMYWGLHIGGRALLNLFAGSLVWEANIFTSPNAASHLATELQGTSSVQVQVLPVALGSTGAGVAVVGRF